MYYKHRLFMGACCISCEVLYLSVSPRPPISTGLPRAVRAAAMLLRAQLRRQKVRASNARSSSCLYLHLHCVCVRAQKLIVLAVHVSG